MSNPRFSADSDNRVTDEVSRLRTACLTPEAAALLVRAGNAADALMRSTGALSSTHEEGGYAVCVDRHTFYVNETA